jgi:hypothetical protein
VEADYRYLSSDIEPVDCFFDRYLDMLEFTIDSYTESLEYSFRRVLVIARSSDDLKEFECRIYRLDLASLDDSSRYMD